ncbi:hypothetical protein FYC62_04010 [Pedobacter aquae]|uniref:Uncharacterized protein n=1 Tax=Pedobacter aquae TaxID=2605747 RepID=A0A5C0VE18_9SPHI|nr:hypothetical protein [Pedobacter aquae]QEK50928.1 hypothetical protein FYC62_04010 [Pedobacter aquae]
MLTYNELIDLRSKLANDEIPLELAKELYWKDFKGGNVRGTQKIGRKDELKFLKKNAKYAIVQIL